LLSVAPRAYETLPENIQIGSLKTEGIFVYTEKDYAKNAGKNPIFIQGKIKNPAFNIKDFLSVSDAKKKIWDCTIVSSGGTVGIQCGFAVYTNKEGENVQFDISPISFNKNYLEFPDAVSKQDVPIPFTMKKAAVIKYLPRLSANIHITVRSILLWIRNRNFPFFSKTTLRHVFRAAPIRFIRKPIPNC